MKHYIYLFLLSCSLLLTACNETLEVSDQTSQTVFPNTDIAFDRYGFQTVDLITLYDETSYELSLTNTESSELDLVLKIDTAGVERYNKLYDENYQILSTDYYALTSEITIAGSSTISIPITFFTEKLINASGGKAAISNFVLPLKIEVANDSIILNSTVCQAIIHTQASNPQISMEEPINGISVADTTGLTTVAFTGYYNTLDVDTEKLTATVNESAADSYNSENGTDYLLLPADQYTYTGITVDAATKKLTFNFEFNTTTLEKGTYLLPLDVTSDLYDVSPGTTIFNTITIENTAPAFLSIFELVSTQPIENDYSGTPVSIDFAEAASLFGVTEEELAGNVVFYGINSDETLITGYTANAPGFWFNKTGDVCSWGETDCVLFAEYVAGSNGTINIGQFPDATAAWDAYSASMALVYDGRMIRYNISLNVIPSFLGTFDLSVSEAVDENYISTPVAFDLAEAASLYGVSEDELKAGISFYTLNADGTLIKDYTANTGYWLNNQGNACSWGAEGCAIYAEYDFNSSFNVGQYPGGTSSGDVFNYTIIMVYNDNLIRYNLTVTIE